MRRIPWILLFLYDAILAIAVFNFDFDFSESKLLLIGAFILVPSALGFWAGATR